MDIPAQTDEASKQLMLIAQRDETKKIFNVPEGSFFEKIIEQGEGFENLDATSIDANPNFVHDRKFKVRNLLGEKERTVGISTLKKGSLTKTSFLIYKETPQGRAANLFEVGYESYSDKKPSTVIVNAVPSGLATGIAFTLDSNNYITYTDAIKFTGSGPMELLNAPPVMKVFDGMELSGLKAEPKNISFQLTKFPYPQSQPTQIVIPRVLGRQSVTS